MEEDEDRRFALRAQLARAGFKVTVALDDVSAAWSLQYCQYDAVIANLGSSNGDVFTVLQEENEREALPSVVILTGGDEYQQTVARTMGAYVVGQTSCSLDALDRLLVG